VIGFLKRNLFHIICGLVAAAAIALGVLGVLSMGKVKEQLTSIAQLHGQLLGPAKNPVNDSKIEAERTRVKTIETQFAGLMERAKTLNVYQPLEPPEGERFFPEPTDNGRRQFRDKYQKQFGLLLEKLHAGAPPTDADIQNAKEAIDDERRLAEAMAGEDARKETVPPPPGGPPDGETHPSGLITEKQARESAATRASIQKARSIYCYATMESLDENTEIYAGLSPNPNDMWRAQVSLWIQQDVVDSLARVNDQAAKRLTAEDPDAAPWVGVLPVKDLISIRVSDYIPNEATAKERRLSGDSPSFPPGKSDIAFTKHQSNEMYEVVQFALKMVVDARAVPTIIDEICKDRFHALLNLEYTYDRSLLENLSMEDKIYGAQPTIVVLMEFETIFFGELYRCSMPPAVLAKLGQTCHKTESDQS